MGDSPGQTKLLGWNWRLVGCRKRPDELGSGAVRRGFTRVEADYRRIRSEHQKPQISAPLEIVRYAYPHLRPQSSLPLREQSAIHAARRAVGTNEAHGADAARQRRSRDRATRVGSSRSVVRRNRSAKVMRCYRSVADAHRPNAPSKCLAVDPIAITNEVVRHRLPPAGLADLPRYPFGSRGSQ
jgi:hypothetical protein